MLKEGDKAPDIQLDSDTGEPFRLSSLRGKKVVLYFYPRADTPGCTVEACEFRDNSKKFAKKNVVIVGISPDVVKSQAKFKDKFSLPFTLLCDVDKTAAQAYGVYKEKNMYGKKVMGIERTTFIIDEDGRIAKIFSKVKAQGHAEQILTEGIFQSA
jgi:peroxiredoxin Q/BCP